MVGSKNIIIRNRYLRKGFANGYMNRRKYIKSLGVITVGTSLAGCTGGDEQQEDTTVEDTTQAAFTTEAYDTTERENTTKTEETTENTTEEETDGSSTDINGWPMPNFDRGQTNYNPSTEDMFEDIGTYSAQWQTLSRSDELDLKYSLEPTIHGGVMYTPAESGVYAINPSEESIVWRQSITKPRRVSASENHVYVASWDTNGETSTINSLVKDNGVIEWSTDVGSLVNHITVYNQSLYCSGQTAVYSINKGSGEIQWKSEHNPIGYQPAVDAERVYLETGEGVVAFDKSSGSKLWHTKIPADNHYWCSTSEGQVFTVGDRVYTLDSQSGEITWQSDPLRGMDHEERIPNFPVIAEDRVIAGGYGNIYAFDRRSGNELWTFEVANRTVPEIIGVGDRIFAISPKATDNDSNEIYSLRFDRTGLQDNRFVPGGPARKPIMADEWWFNRAWDDITATKK